MFNTLCLPQKKQRTSPKKMNTIVLAWGDGILLNWIRKRTTTTNENHFCIFNNNKNKLNAHRFDIHKIIVHKRKTESMKRTRKYASSHYANCINLYAKICLLLLLSSSLSSSSIFFFFISVTLPLIDHIFYIFCNSSTFCGFNSMLLFYIARCMDL